MRPKFNGDPGQGESGPATDIERAERGFGMSAKRLLANIARERKFRTNTKQWDAIAEQWSMLVDATDKLLVPAVVGGIALTGVALTASVATPFAVAAGVSMGGGMLLYNGIGRLGRWIAENRAGVNYDKAEKINSKP